jgi:hypothetical protein
MAVRIFKDDDKQALFDKQGFLVVPFLEKSEVDFLDKTFDELHPQLPSEGFISGSFSPDFDYKKRASDTIVKVFGRHFEELFINYQAIGGAFLYKLPSQNSGLAIHQDWTIVDEEKYVALNCWVPLTDVDENNGALQIVPGSHYDALKTLRAPTLPFFFSGNDDMVIEASVPLRVKAGEAVILNQSVIHYSPPNRSSQIRKAITAGVISQGAPLHFHYKDASKAEEVVEVFEMPEDFLISFKNFATEIFQRPIMGQSIGFKPYNPPQFSRENLKVEIERMKAVAGFGPPLRAPKNIFQRIAQVFQ